MPYPNYLRELGTDSPTRVRIQNYHLNFEPLLYQVRVGGKFNIESNVPFPHRSIYAKLRLPNQAITDVYLSHSGETCTSSGDLPCRSYEISTYMGMAGDGFFKREILWGEEIPLDISFHVDANNLQLSGDRSKIEVTRERMMGAVRSLEANRISTRFRYHNTSKIINPNGDQTINVPLSWSIINGIGSYDYGEFKFRVPEVTGPVVNGLFAISSAAGKYRINPIGSHLQMHGMGKVPLGKDLKPLRLNNWTWYHLGGSVIKGHEKYTLIPDIGNSLSLPQGEGGALHSEIILLAGGSGHRVHIVRGFSENRQGELHLEIISQRLMRLPVMRSPGIIRL